MEEKTSVNPEAQKALDEAYADPRRTEQALIAADEACDNAYAAHNAAIERYNRALLSAHGIVLPSK